MKKILAAFLIFTGLGAKAALPTVGTPPGQRYMVSGASITAVTGSFSGSVTASSVTALGGILSNGGANAGQITSNSSSGITQFKWQRGGTTKWSVNNNVAGTDFFNLQNEGLGTSAFSVDFTNNNVGIGTASPGRLLDVNGAGVVRGNFDVAGGSVTILGDSSGNIMTMKSAIASANSLRFQSASGSVYIDNEQQGAITFRTDSSIEKMVILNSGNVGIGTASPTSKLDVNGNAQFGSGATKSTFTTTGQLQVGGTGNSTFYGSTVTVANSGFVSAPSQPGAGANRTSSALSIADSTATELLFNSNNYTQGGLGFTSKSTAPVAGIYYVGCGVSWVSNATGVRQLCIVSSNIGQEACDVRFAGAAGSAINQSISKMVSLAANDMVSCTVTQTSGGALNAEASEMTYGVLQKVW